MMRLLEESQTKQTASDKIERIKSIFLETQFFYAEHNNINKLNDHLKKLETEFISVGYESASMAIALKDFEENNNLLRWKVFAGGTRHHKAQVYIGLGWAIAKRNIIFSSIIDHLDPKLNYRVADGCGYYDGSFKQRQTIINQQFPVYLPPAALTIYYQGVGRSLWYSNNADIEKVTEKIKSFPHSIHAALWRGIGVAVAYVGGCDEIDLKSIFKHAEEDGMQLACGAALAAKSRIDANTLTRDTNRCYRMWFHLAEKDNMLPISSVSSESDEKVYLNWMMQVELALSKSFETDN